MIRGWTGMGFPLLIVFLRRGSGLNIPVIIEAASLRMAF